MLIRKPIAYTMINIIIDRIIAIILNFKYLKIVTAAAAPSRNNVYIAIEINIKIYIIIF